MAIERKRMRMKALSRFGFAAVAVAAAAALVVTLAPGLFGRGPLAEFGVLPPLASGLPDDRGVSGGPGYTFEFDYSLGASLTAGWPAMPGRQTVYRLAPFDFTEAHVAALASGLGLTAPVVRQGWRDSYTLSTGTGDGARMIMAFPDGYVIYDENYDYGPADRSALPTADRAIEISRSWLIQFGFVPGDAAGPGALGAAKVTEELDQGSLLVAFRPAEPADVVTINPYAAVRIGRGAKIVMGQATWYPAAGTSPYPLRKASEAWEIVKAGLGVLKIDFNKYGPFGDVEVVTGPAVVDSVRLGWGLTVGADKTPYLVPVYVFSGTADVPNTKSPAGLPFEVWAPAVAVEYVGR